MAERMIKTLKHGITILASNPANVNCWDETPGQGFVWLPVWSASEHKIFTIHDPDWSITTSQGGQLFEYSDWCN
jgi:hypothetical protein